MAAIVVGDVKARAKDDLGRAQGTLAAAEEAKHKAKEETRCLEVE